MQQATCVAAAIKLARKWMAPKRRHALDATRLVGPAVEPSTPQSSVKRSSGGRLLVSLVRWRRRSANDDHWRTMNIHGLDGTL